MGPGCRKPGGQSKGNFGSWLGKAIAKEIHQCHVFKGKTSWNSGASVGQQTQLWGATCSNLV